MVEKKLEKLAKIERPVLITGPTGAGKSRAGKRIHRLSERRSQKFIHANLGNFPSSLFESEFFGHERGAFTGAHARRAGLAEAVGGGTLFLDEVGDLCPKNQAKLLMLLEEGIFYSVGSSAPKKFLGRCIFATNRDLEQMVARGGFREDLFQRIRTFELRLPKLADRPDLEEVIEEVFARTKRLHAPNLLLGSDLFQFLKVYSWPGNYRELKNAMEHVCFFAEGAVARLEDLPDYLRERVAENNISLEGSYRTSLESFERAYLIKALAQRGFRINQTAREINISKVTLLSKMKKYDIKKEYNNLSGNIKNRAV